MNFLFSILFLFLSNILYCSEKIPSSLLASIISSNQAKQRQRSNSLGSDGTVEETIRVVTIAGSRHDDLLSKQNKLLELKLAESELTGIKLTAENELLKKTLQTTEDNRNLHARDNVILRANQTSLTTQINQLGHRLSTYGNENFRDYFCCSLVSPTFQTILCWTLAPECSKCCGCDIVSLPARIELKKHDYHQDKYYYYDTKTEQYFHEFQGPEKNNCENFCLCCGCCCFCIRSKLPYYVEKRPHNTNPRKLEYYDKRNGETIEDVAYNCFEECCIDICGQNHN